MVAAAVIAVSLSSAAWADEEELRKEIELLKKRLQQLEQRLPVTSPSPVATPGAAQTDADLDADLLGSTSSGNWADRTSMGGYGEMHLSFGDKRELDFHRWVLFVNHEFNDRFRFVSEVELEHSIAGEGKNGEIELEQAYLDVSLGNGFHAQGDLFLMPIGILNETHEPATFFGTERNPIEKEIIPSTWWEGGLELGRVDESGLQWDVAFHSGLAVDPADYRIRGGRQKVSKADASEWASTARVRYTGVPGVEVGVSAQYQSDLTPGQVERNDAVLGEAHVQVRKGGFGLRALGAYWSIDGSTPESMGLDEQWGFYLEPSYTFAFDTCGKLGFFGRYNKFDASKGQLDQWDAGLNYWPIDNVVLKADFSHLDTHGKASESIYNIGLGYQF